MMDERDRSTGTVRRLQVRLAEELAKRHPGETITMPAYSTLWKYVKQLDTGHYTLSRATLRRTAHNRPDRTFNSRDAILPGQEVQADTTTLDVLVLDDNGEPRRPKLTILIDKATRSILAFSLLLETSAYDHTMLLAQALVPAPARPGHEFLDKLQLPKMPWTENLTAEELSRYDTAQPWMPIHRIITDNGKDYLSVQFRSACQFFAIDLTESSVRTPTDKGIVERAFGTMKTSFASYLPGYTGGDVANRGKAPANDQLLDIYTLTQLLRQWVAIVWQNTTNSELRDPFHPGVVHTPNSMYAARFDFTGFHPIPLTADDYIELMPAVDRTIQADGITVNRRRYDSVDLHPFRLGADRNGKAKKWRVKHDPYNPAQVWIRDPETDQWVTCDWMNASDFDLPFADEIRTRALEFAELYGSIPRTSVGSLTTELLKAERAAAGIAAKRQSRIAVSKRSHEISGLSMALPSDQTPTPIDDDIDSYDELGELTFEPFFRN